MAGIQRVPFYGMIFENASFVITSVTMGVSITKYHKVVSSDIKNYKLLIL